MIDEEEEWYWLIGYLLKVQFKENRLFLEVEQGSGKHSNDIIVIV